VDAIETVTIETVTFERSEGIRTMIPITTKTLIRLDVVRFKVLTAAGMKISHRSDDGGSKHL
jgi:hypothetical protein